MLRPDPIIYDVPLELHDFLPSDTECHIVSYYIKSTWLSLKRWLMTLNMPQEKSNVPPRNCLQMEFILRKRQNKQIINIGTWSDTLHHISWIFLDPRHSTRHFSSRWYFGLEIYPLEKVQCIRSSYYSYNEYLSYMCSPLTTCMWHSVEVAGFPLVQCLECYHL